MGPSRRQRKRCQAVLAVFIAAVGVAFGFSIPVGAADEASGSAFGLFAEGLIDIEPEPQAVFPPGGQDTTIEIDLGGLLLACTLNASSQGFDGAGNEVDTVAEAESVESSASVESAVLLGNPDADCDGAGGDPGSGGLIDFLDDVIGGILGGTGLPLTAIASECTADENGARGSSTVVGLGGGGDVISDLLGGGLDLNQLALDLGLTVGADLGILQLALDEQIEDADGNGITVRALRLTLLPGTGGTEPLQEVILAESQCRLVADAAGTTTTTVAGGTTSTVPDGPDDDDASNESDIINRSDGTAAIDTGDASAVGNISNTAVNQTADVTGGNAGVDQDATVVNAGEAAANTGANTAVGNNSTNVVSNDQTAVAVDGGATADDPGATAANTSSATNESNGTAAISTGDAAAVGNVSDTEINQTANVAGGAGHCGTACEPAPCGECPQPCPHPEPECPVDCEPVPQPCESVPCGGTCDPDPACGCSNHWWNPGWFWGGGSSVNQSATVVNSGTAVANTGGNSAIGNNSVNVVTNEQTAVAVDD